MKTPIYQKGIGKRGTQSFCAYVTYADPESAKKAIEAYDDKYVDAMSLKVSLAMTKYCTYWLACGKCPKIEKCTRYIWFDIF